MTDTEPDLVPFAGQWVALADGRVAAAAESAHAAEALARRARPDAALAVRQAPPIRVLDALPQPELLERLQPLLAHEPAWLVGGAVRDMLLGRPVHDLDFAVDGDGVALARRIADRLGAGFYALDAARGTGRAVVQRREAPPFVIDCAALRVHGQGRAGLLADLAARDFTINAMALPPGATSAAEVIDPLGGRADLAARCVRAAGADTIRADPNRTLRALRLAAELNFTLDAYTQGLLHRDGAGLRAVSAERVRDEFVKLLCAPGAAGILRQLDGLGLLGLIVPEVDAMRGVMQGYPHYEDVLGHTLTVFDRLEAVWGALGLAPARPDAMGQARALDLMAERLRTYAPQLAGHFAVLTGDTRTRRGLLALAALLHDCGKPATRQQAPDTGRTFFPQHDTVGARLAAERARALRLSASEAQWVGAIVRAHMLAGWHGGVDALAAYRYFRGAGDAGVDTAIFSLADQMAAHARYEHMLERWALKVAAVEALLDHYFHRYAEVVAPPVLLTGHDLMEALGLRPGRAVGELLEQVREAQVVGRAKDKEEALALARGIVAEGEQGAGSEERGTHDK